MDPGKYLYLNSESCNQTAKSRFESVPTGILCIDYNTRRMY